MSNSGGLNPFNPKNNKGNSKYYIKPTNTEARESKQASEVVAPAPPEKKLAARIKVNDKKEDNKNSESIKKLLTTLQASIQRIVTSTKFFLAKLLPTIKKISNKIPYEKWFSFIKKQPKKVRLGVIMGLVLLVSAALVFTKNEKQVTEVLNTNTSTNQTGAEGDLPISDAPEQVEFKVLTPNGKKLEEVKGVVRTNPNKEKIVTFKDTLDGIEIEVTQQAMPEAFKPEIATKVENLAISYNATESVSEGDTVIYVGSTERGPQSVISNTEESLIFIRSLSKISNDSWMKYVRNLE